MDYNGKSEPIMNVKSKGPLRVLEITDPGRFNHEDGEAYSESLYGALPRESGPGLAVDLGGVELLSSRGVRTLVNLKRRVERTGGRMILIQVRPSLDDQLRTTRLAEHFPRAADDQGALELLSLVSPV